MRNLLLLLSALFLSSCASVSSTGGALFYDIKYGLGATSNTEMNKKGEACQSSVLGLVGSRGYIN